MAPEPGHGLPRGIFACLCVWFVASLDLNDAQSHSKKEDHMDDSVTADRVLATAMDLEQTGHLFYASLAEGCEDRLVARLCARLAKAEAGHAAVFAKLREQLRKRRPIPPLT